LRATSADDQSESVRFLKGLAADPRVVETHAAIVVLAGERALKLKRAVKLPYLDFSTPELRLAVCERELALNRRTAPALYRAVRRITRGADGRLGFDGEGPLVDAVVEMARFDEDGLFDRLATRGALTPALLAELARSVADFHAEAEVATDRGGAAIMASVLDINARALATTSVFAADRVARFDAAFRAALDRHAVLLDARAAAGFVRRCHGDLHLRNICLLDGRPTLFDCLEFDEAMATIDVLYDLAFLVMDLWHRDLRALANLVLNRYLDAAEEEDEAAADGLPLLPFFMAVRAAVRAHVGATRIESGGDTPAARAEAEDYFALAERLLVPAAPRLVAVGGLSGSGKSTAAAALADAVGPAPGARVLASDRLRKRLHGVSAETRLPAEAYRPEVSEKVYGQIFERAARLLAAGHGVVSDAVFDRAEDRRRIAAVAAAAGVPFRGVWLEAPAATLVERVEHRRGGPSDATGDVVRGQLARFDGAIEWTRIDTASGRDETARRARAAAVETGG